MANSAALARARLKATLAEEAGVTVEASASPQPAAKVVSWGAVDRLHGDAAKHLERREALQGAARAEAERALLEASIHSPQNRAARARAAGARAPADAHASNVVRRTTDDLYARADELKRRKVALRAEVEAGMRERAKPKINECVHGFGCGGSLLPSRRCRPTHSPAVPAGFRATLPRTCPPRRARSCTAAAAAAMRRAGLPRRLQVRRSSPFSPALTPAATRARASGPASLWSSACTTTSPQSVKRA